VPGRKRNFLINAYGIVVRRNQAEEPGQGHARRRHRPTTQRTRDQSSRLSHPQRPCTVRVTRYGSCVMHTHTTAGLAVAAAEARPAAADTTRDALQRAACLSRLRRRRARRRQS
jgi:hypothetical protein